MQAYRQENTQTYISKKHKDNKDKNLHTHKTDESLKEGNPICHSVLTSKNNDNDSTGGTREQEAVLKRKKTK